MTITHIRTHALRAALALTVAVFANSAAAAAATGADALLQPGAPLCLTRDDAPELLAGCADGHGTLGFVLRDRQGALFITTAAHGFSRTGERAVGPTIGPFGTVVVDDDSGIIDPAALPASNGTDVALIRIDHAQYGNVDPSVREIGGPTHELPFGEGKPGELIAMYGQGSGPDGTPLGQREGTLDRQTGLSFTASGLIAQEGSGDNGSPYVHTGTGAALGVNANCVCGGEFGYPTVAHLLERLRTFGFELSLVTAKHTR